MKFVAAAALFSLPALVVAHDLNFHHARHAQHAKRASSGSATPTATPAPQVTPTGAGTDIPPLSSILSGAAPEATFPLTASFAAGATPPISGAPPLPTECT